MISEYEYLLKEKYKININSLDSGANKYNWKKGEKRGGFDYKPAYGWIGFGLKVWGYYDGGNNEWLSHNGNKNEWPVAYIRDGYHTINYILNGTFKIGYRQAYQDYPDINHPGQKMGVGIYCTPDPSIMEDYASYDNMIDYNGKKYIIGLMMRVKPDKIRCCSEQKDYWILNPTSDEIRPYRILIKEIK